VSASWSEARRVLCVRLDNLGDVLMTTPAIRALKEALPGRQVTLLASRAGAAAAAHIPEIDAAIPYDAPWMKLARPTLPSADLAMRSLIEARRFDAAVIFTVYSQSALPAALLCHLAGIPLRLAHARENPYHLLTDWVRETDPGQVTRHEVRRQLDLVARIGARTGDERLSFRTSAEERLHAAMKLAESGIDPEQRWIAMHVGASAASRRYAPERFARVACELARLLGCAVALTGDAGERELVETVRRAAGPSARSLAGALTLGEFAALIGQAPLLVSNNTGAVHLAAAQRTPVVDLYALTNPQHTPWQVPHRVLSHDVPCRNCYQSECPHGRPRCLDIPVEEVVAAACALWNGGERAWKAAA
jgi:lipopolysaccharide heptosyltransferase II